jgi:hypothetical protein
MSKMNPYPLIHLPTRFVIVWWLICFCGCSEESTEPPQSTVEELAEATAAEATAPAAAPAAAPTAPEKTNTTDETPEPSRRVTPLPEGWTPNGNWLVITSALLDHEDIRNTSVTDRAQLEQMVDAMTVTFTDDYYVVTMNRPTGAASRMKTPYKIVERTPTNLVIELVKEDGQLVQGVLELDGEDLTIATADDTRSLKLRRK